jgi:hypothetical protein
MSDPFEQASSAAPSDGAYSADGKPDRYGRYKLVDPATGEVRPYTRATTFAKSISDTFTLSLWSQRMVAKGLAMRPDLVGAARQGRDRHGASAVRSARRGVRDRSRRRRHRGRAGSHRADCRRS